MIEVSDNDAADTVYQVIGNAGLEAVAAAAGMRHFSVYRWWTYARISAAHHEFADHLLSHIAGYESWGVPAVARPFAWTVWFKGGWRGTERGQLVHQVARLQFGDTTIAVAVMTDDDPSMSYGIETVEGVTAELLGR
jgi:hypothetical protein